MQLGLPEPRSRISRSAAGYLTLGKHVFSVFLLLLVPVFSSLQLGF